MMFDRRHSSRNATELQQPSAGRKRPRATDLKTDQSMVIMHEKER